MNKKPKLVYGIKGKLVSAACMLLVAVIMVVSSTYAWFTLSTAPEVTGINTAVGANGSLEMALLPSNGVADGVTSEVGDATKPIDEKNLTWGNLVDLSHVSYGLNQIIMYPSLLNVDENGNLPAAMLQTPTYGSDGRLDKLVAETLTGVFSTEDQKFIPAEKTFGVRAVGVASGMTARQTDYRNARSTASTAISAAKALASASLNANGGVLANLAIKKASGGSDYNQDDVAALQAIVTDLIKEDGVLEQIETAYMQLLLALAASAQGGADANYTAVKAVITTEGATLDSVLTELQKYIAVDDLPANLGTAITKFAATKASVLSAQDDLTALTTKGTITWDDLSTPLNKLADPSNMKINGYTTSEAMSNLSSLVQAVVKDGGLSVTLMSGGGVYADIADHCGNYTANVVVKEVTYGGVTLNDTPAKMTTDSSVDTAYLAEVAAAAEAAGAPENTGGEVLPITEMYGYVIDLAFRTNAPDSKLMLSTAKDRIYSDNTNPETMGHGSTMSFVSTLNDEFNADQVEALMGAIRIVFFTPDATGATGGTVICYAQLDMENVKTTADGLTAAICLLDAEGNLITDETKAEIMALQQNTATALSVLVYVDGSELTNEDVAATVATSMTGKMNLQFCSSAKLAPMEYADLHPAK